jgi:hypothetical protein
MVLSASCVPIRLIWHITDQHSDLEVFIYYVQLIYRDKFILTPRNSAKMSHHDIL